MRVKTDQVRTKMLLLPKSFQESLKCHKRFKKMERAPPVWGLRRAILQEVVFKVGLRHLLEFELIWKQ